MVTVLRTPVLTKRKFASHVPHMEFPMNNLVKRFARDESGATAIEYGLIAAGIALAIITVVNTLGAKVATTFDTITTKMN